MPIKQSTMVELMKESRAAIQNNFELRHALQAYIGNAKARYPRNLDLQEVLHAIDMAIRAHPEPSDKATYRNEYHYRRVGKNNDAQRIRQAARRRQDGVPTQEESIERLKELNALRRTGGSQSYAAFNRGEPLPKVTKGVILPRDYPDDKPLEFESQAPDLGQREENLPSGPSFGLDIPPDPYDNGDT